MSSCASASARRARRTWRTCPSAVRTGEPLAALRSVTARRKVFAHVNNTNPMLLEGSEAWREVAGAGFDIAVDGMELLS